MFIKSIWIGFIGVMLFVASASAESSVLQGIVKDPKGHPIQGADIRIEATNTCRLLTTALRIIRKPNEWGLQRVSQNCTLLQEKSVRP